MVDIVITAANVVPGTDAQVRSGTAGVAVAAGQIVHLDSADNRYKLADNDDAEAIIRSPAGIALNNAAAGQPLSIVARGRVTLGAVLTAGVAYYLSSTPGGMAPVADLGVGDYPVIIGIAISTSVLKVAIQEAGVSL